MIGIPRELSHGNASYSVNRATRELGTRGSFVLAVIASDGFAGIADRIIEEARGIAIDHDSGSIVDGDFIAAFFRRFYI